jgi:hypothetical protein
MEGLAIITKAECVSMIKCPYVWGSTGVRCKGST